MKIKGNKKPNDLVGTTDDDKIIGLGGDDHITATGGHDTVDAGSGDDKIVIALDTSATVDAGKGNDTVKVTAGALGSTIDLGKGDDKVEIKASSQAQENFTIIGGDGDDTVNFAVDEADFKSAIRNGDGSYTVTDMNDNIYTISGIEKLTFNGADFQGPGNPTNQAPIVSNQIADQSVSTTAFSFQFAANTFTDPDGDSLTYSATLADGSALPGWLSFDGATRTFSGAPGVSNVGAISIRVTASDGTLTVPDEFTLTVSNTPTPPGPTIVDPVVSGGVLYLDHFYDYDVSEGAGKIAVSYAGKTMLFDASTINSVVTLGSSSVDIDTSGWGVRGITGDVNYTHVNFTAAGPGGPFESTFELGPNAIPASGEATVNGNAADYFRAAWDWLDDRYTQSPSNYYAEQLNSFGIDLGIKYALYLEHGGAPLFDTAKFSATRNQTLHDNLLGNLDENSIIDKFNPKAPGSEFYSADDIGDRIVNAGLGDYLGVIGDINDGRGIFTGNQNDIDSAAHNRVRAFDYANGIARSDYNFFDDNGNVDAAATTGGHMYFGTGNSPANYVISQHEGAGIETALKVHVRGGADYMPTLTTLDHVVHFNVDQGAGSAASWGTPAKWNFDYSIVTGLNGSAFDMDDFDFKIKVDMDSSAGVNYQVFDLQHVAAGNTPFTSAFGGFADEDGSNANISQNSVNLGFGFLKDHIDGGGYSFGAGTFDIELLAYEAGTNNVLSNVHIQVHVV